jgi:glycosyltransferase involved in cell wall biosynthesis
MVALLRAYLETFEAGEDVCLLIKTALRDMTRFRHGPVWEQLVSRSRDSVPWLVHRIRREYPRAAPVRLVPFELSAARIAALHRRGDCYVSLTHSEGWGLGAFDAAAAGKPVILTGYGAPLEYLPAEHAWLVGCEEVQMPRISYVTYAARWADPDLAQARRLMRYAAEHRAEGRQRGERLATWVRERYDPAVVTDLLLRALA